MGPPGSGQLPPLRVHAKGVNKAVIKQRLIRVRLIFTSSKSLSAGIQKLKSKDWGPQLEPTFDSRRQPRMDLGLVDACPRLVDSIIAASIGIKQMIDEIRLRDILANSQAQSLAAIEEIPDIRQALACRNLATN